MKHYKYYPGLVLPLAHGNWSNWSNWWNWPHIWLRKTVPLLSACCCCLGRKCKILWMTLSNSRWNLLFLSKKQRNGAFFPYHWYFILKGERHDFWFIKWWCQWWKPERLRWIIMCGFNLLGVFFFVCFVLNVYCRMNTILGKYEHKMNVGSSSCDYYVRPVKILIICVCQLHSVLEMSQLSCTR